MTKSMKISSDNQKAMKDYHQAMKWMVQVIVVKYNKNPAMISCMKAKKQ